MKSKVLIVDDNSDNLVLLQLIVQKMGFYTQLAINGIDAIKFIKQDPPDLILLDLYMPQMDGLETIALINKKYKIPTIIVTSADNGAIKIIKEMGVLFIVQKPIIPNVLQKEINKCFEYYENK